MKKNEEPSFIQQARKALEKEKALELYRINQLFIEAQISVYKEIEPFYNKLLKEGHLQSIILRTMATIPIVVYSQILSKEIIIKMLTSIVEDVFNTNQSINKSKT